MQVGDPFCEKMLIECCLKLLDEGLLVSLQDLGAAGITSSASEMAARGGVGIEIETDMVPLRESGMEPTEVMISESQERMLAIVEPEKVDEVLWIAERYGLVGAVVGRVADHGDLRVIHHGEEAGTVPAEYLADDPADDATRYVQGIWTTYPNSTWKSFQSRKITTPYFLRCWGIRTSVRGVPSSPSTTTRWARTAWSCPALTPR